MRPKRFPCYQRNVVIITSNRPSDLRLWERTSPRESCVTSLHCALCCSLYQMRPIDPIHGSVFHLATYGLPLEALDLWIRAECCEDETKTKKVSFMPQQMELTAEQVNPSCIASALHPVDTRLLPVYCSNRSFHKFLRPFRQILAYCLQIDHGHFLEHFSLIYFS